MADNILGIIILLMLYGIYASIIYGLVFLLRWLKVSAKWAIVIAFLIFGMALGVWVTNRGLQDSTIIFNFPGILAGDEVYQWAIQHLGNPHSFQAHYTIPWVLRTPQVYIWTTLVVWGLFGLAVQVIYNFRQKIASLFRKRNIGEVEIKKENI